MKLAIGGNHILFSIAAAVLGLILSAGAAGAETLELRPGDHICLVGNALGERMQFGNSWETLLYQRFPKHELVVRNLCFPGDEPFNARPLAQFRRARRTPGAQQGRRDSVLLRLQ